MKKVLIGISSLITAVVLFSKVSAQEGTAANLNMIEVAPARYEYSANVIGTDANGAPFSDNVVVIQTTDASGNSRVVVTGATLPMLERERDGQAFRLSEIEAVVIDGQAYIRTVLPDLEEICSPIDLSNLEEEIGPYSQFEVFGTVLSNLEAILPNALMMEEKTFMDTPVKTYTTMDGENLTSVTLSDAGEITSLLASYSGTVDFFGQMITEAGLYISADVYTDVTPVEIPASCQVQSSETTEVTGEVKLKKPQPNQ
jgi:hypothetical protein